MNPREGWGSEIVNDPACERLVDKIRTRSGKIGIVGLGYVGLPIAVAFVEAGFNAVGFDLQQSVVDTLQDGHCHLRHFEEAAIKKAVVNGSFSATTAMSRLSEPDVIVVCVPTPLMKDRTPDLRQVVAAIEQVALYLRAGQLVVLESTTYPGTLTDVVRPVLQDRGLKVGADVWLAYAPEREDPGNAAFPVRRMPRVIGADDAASLAVTRELYQTISPQVHLMSSSRAAEAVKLAENVFRAVNVALANELKLIFEAMGIDVWEVIDGAATKPFGFTPFFPGPGVGGHCIPVDPWYLVWASQRAGESANLVETACRVNDEAPARVIDVLRQRLSRPSPLTLAGLRILVLGVAYKRDIGDVRDSPALRLMEIVERDGGQVDYHDPLVDVLPAADGVAEQFVGCRSVEWSAQALESYDAVIVATDHSAINYAELAITARLVVDTRNACARAGVDTGCVVRA